MTQRSRGWRAAVLAAMLAGGAAALAGAATYTVTTTADSGAGSLRQAILDANGNAGADTITISATGTVSVGSTMSITDAVTITGPGAANYVLDGGGTVRILAVDSTTNDQTVSISGVTFTAGYAATGIGGAIQVGTGDTLNLTSCAVTASTAVGSGGGIGNFGTVNLVGSLVNGNTASNGSGGGGIYTDTGSTLTATDSTISNNHATTSSGGGIYNSSNATLIRCTVSGNTCAGYGAGIRTDASGQSGAGTLRVVNSTISGNTTDLSGGGIALVNAGTVELANSTITNNTADADQSNNGLGGGVYRGAGTMNAQNTIIAGNTSGNSVNTYPDCNGQLTSIGYNLIGDTTGCTILGSTTGNITGVSADLGSLADNGGPTLTHLPNAGSPAIDAGDTGGCDDDLGSPLSTDQRGLTRPVNGRCDIGAVEVQAAVPTGAPIPAVSRIGLAVLAALLAFGGVAAFRRAALG